MQIINLSAPQGAQAAGAPGSVDYGKRGDGTAWGSTSVGAKHADSGMEKAPPLTRAASEPVDTAAAKAGLRRSEGFLTAGRYREASEEAARSLRVFQSPRAWEILAAAQNRLGNPEAAERAAKAAARESPKSTPALRELAWSQLRQRKFLESAETAEKGIALDSNNALFHLLRAFSLERVGNRMAAIEELRRAAALDPRFHVKLEKALKGGAIYDPEGDAALINGILDHPAKAMRGPWLWAIFGLLAGLALAAGAAAWYFLLGRGRLREARRIQLTPAPWASRRLADKYELGRLIGRGGMGAVFEATDHSLGRVVAVKKLDHSAAVVSDASRARFVAEARAVAALRHPAIVVIHEIVEQEGEVYLVFELVVGSTVAQLLAQSGPLPPAKVHEILRPVCKALEFAHNKGFVHRDLKPANIMVTTDGEVKLMDFGLARAMSSAPGAATQTQTIAGTPVYMAPEVANGVVSREGDIYALGVTLYEMLTGTLPFSPECPAMARVDSKYQPPSVKVAGLPVELDRLVAAALEPNPVRRVKSAKAFLDRLKTSSKALSDTPVS